MRENPIEAYFQAKGARICYFSWGKPGDPVVFLIHATGFHARCWDETVAALPSGFRVVAVDLRGHGRSEKTGLLGDWALPALDVLELIDHLAIEGAVGVGHSMGGHVLVQVAAARPNAFKRLVLVDPVMLAPEVYANRHAVALSPETEHPVARRRNQWASWKAMFEAFKHRAPYSLWRPQVLEDYCRYGLLTRPDGQGFELACPPAIEASMYMGHDGTDIYALAARVAVPVVVLRAKPRVPGPRDMTDFSASPTWEGVARVFANGRDVPLPHLTHFIPMQDPELTARFIADERAKA